jgi:hypothetical protein
MHFGRCNEAGNCNISPRNHAPTFISVVCQFTEKPWLHKYVTMLYILFPLFERGERDLMNTFQARKGSFVKEYDKGTDPNNRYELFSDHL